MTLQEAIRSFTVDAAFAAFEDGEKGVLAPGKWADVAVLEKDITAIPPPEIPQTKVWATIVGGEVVYGAE
jgi:predicted amidohydrolase YtcJ